MGVSPAELGVFLEGIKQQYDLNMPDIKIILHTWRHPYKCNVVQKSPGQVQIVTATILKTRPTGQKADLLVSRYDFEKRKGLIQRVTVTSVSRLSKTAGQ